MKLHKTPSARRQRGAVLIMTAAFMVAAIALLALAVDTGRLYAAQAKLQSSANLAALAAARQASGCRLKRDEEDLFTPEAGKEKARTVVRNNYGATESGPEVSAYDRGIVTTSKEKLRHFSPDDGSGTPKPNAVRLTLTNTSYKPLFPLFRGDKKTKLQASAGALSRPEAAIQIGTSLAHIKPRVLRDLLGLSVDVGDIGNLAQAHITLAKLLKAKADVVTMDDFTTPEPDGGTEITINDALGRASDNVNYLAIDVIEAVQGQLGDQPLSKILSIAGPVGSDASVSIGALVNSAAQLIAKDRTNAVPIGLSFNKLPAGLGGVSAKLRILQPAQSKVGPAGQDSAGNYYTKVDSAQVAITLALNLELLQKIEILKLPLVINVAGGEARLDKILCPSPTNRSYEVQVHGSTSTVTAGVGTIKDDKFTPSEISILDDTITVSNNDPDNLSTISPKDYDVSFDIADLDDLPEKKAPPDIEELSTQELTGLLSNIHLRVDIGKNLPLISDLVDKIVDTAGGILDWIGDILGGTSGDEEDETNLTTDILLAPVNAVLQKLLAPVLQPVLDPILHALGISLSTADITLQGISPNQPVLFCASDEDCGFDD